MRWRQKLKVQLGVAGQRRGGQWCRGLVNEKRLKQQQFGKKIDDRGEDKLKGQLYVAGSEVRIVVGRPRCERDKPLELLSLAQQELLDTKLAEAIAHIPLDTL